MNQGLRSLYAAILLSIWVFTGCGSKGKQKGEPADTPISGTIHINVDESFKPIVSELIKVYESNQPDTHIVPHYMPESDCIAGLWPDSIRMIITTKALSAGEREFISDSIKLDTRQSAVARDAVAVIVNPASADSVFTMQDIREILEGRFKKKLIPVFDGVKATGTVRFIVDSVLHGAKLTPDAVAARSSDSVINYVASVPGAVGFIGVTWIGNPDDEEQKSFLKKVKIAWIESSYTPGKYILPVQANIYTKQYPMVRDLVYLLKERHSGLGRGFATFMEGEIGQLIFRRAYLAPLLRDFSMRAIRLNESSQ
ncbi:substrate-binding domain-containing protein [Nostoc ellipsosporum NOK]|nr:substrate-binding domain-containing protein [Nostoc ellipsosporum NOK]